MKRILSLILAIALCLSVLPGAALAEPAETEPKETVSETVEEAAEETTEEVPEETPAASLSDVPEETGETPPEEPEAVEESEGAPADALVITEEPEDTLLLEGRASFYVSAAVYRGETLTEESPSYQWQVLEGDTWADLPEQTDRVLVLEELTEEDLGGSYRCRVTWGDLEAVSRSASVTGPAPEEETGETGTVSFINPLYEDVLTEEDLPRTSQVSAYAGDTAYDSEEAFSAAVKQALLSHQLHFEGKVQLQKGQALAGENYMKYLYRLAVAHTGVPTEGDYLKFEFGGYTGGYNWDSKTGVFSCYYDFLYYSTARQEEETDAKAREILEALDLSEKTDKEKVDAIYGYLCTNVKYDYTNLNNSSYRLKYTAYAALCKGTAVCQGYAAAFYRLCLASGVDTRVISSNAMNHAWNIVNLGRFYYQLDATWDANHPDNYRYYLKGSTDWLKNHKNGKGISVLGDEFDDAAFSERYPLPLESYGASDGDYTLLEDGTLVLGETYSEQIPDYREGLLNGVATTAAPWREVAEQIRRIQFPESESFRSIGQNAFRGLPNLEEVVIPKTVNNISSNAFRDCTGLKKLTISSGPDTGADVFTGCSIETLTVPGEWCAGPLQGCLESLKKLTVTDGGYMANYTPRTPAPWSGTGVATVTFDDSLLKIGNYAFADCGSIEKLTLPANLRYIGNNAFDGCGNLRSVELPEKLEKIYAGAFRNCTGLESLTFPEKLTTLMAAFEGCTGLKTLTFLEDSLPTLHEAAFQGLTLTCIYPCSWRTAPTGNYGGKVTWQGGHTPEYVSGRPVSQTEDGILEHWRCSACGRLFREESCDTELAEEDVVLYRETYDIRYEGVENGDNPNPAAYAAARGLTLQDAVRTGYLFGGWYGADGKRVTSIAKGTHGDLTLTAKWTAISYTLTFNAAGGSGSASRKSLSYDMDVVLPDTGFYRRGYTLSGWNTAKDGSGEDYAPGATVRNLTAANRASVILYARWEPISYTLVLDPGDGEAEPLSVALRYGESYMLPTDAGNLEGSHISAWTTQAGGKGKSYTAGKPVTNLTSADGDRVTLYGRWTVNGYTVVFHSNDGADRQRKQSFTYGKTAALTGNAFSRTGYVFSGWSTSESGEAVYNNRDRVTSLTAENEGTVDLYAVWTPISYQIAFKPNGASGEMEPLAMEYGREAALPELAYEYPGFTFLGWSTTSTGKVLYENGKTVGNLTATQGRTVTLYARWQAHSYEIQFYGGDGTTGTTRAMTKLSCGKTYTLTANGFKKAGYDFAGWVDTDGRVYANRYKGSNFVLEDDGVLKLTAQWIPHPYTITYKNCIAYDENGNPAQYDALNPVELQNAVRPGTKFLGWYLDSRCTKPITSTESYAQNLTLYAKWGTSPSYTIHFESVDHATGKMADMTGLICGKVYTLKANSFKRTGYTFAGWALSPDGEAVYANRAKFGNLWQEDGEDVTLYARWTPTAYKITYQKLIAADENPNPLTFTVEDTVELAAPRRPGCDFLGWYLDSAYKTPVEELPAGSRTSNLTLYARWENSGRGYGYTIAFDGNGAASGKMNPMTGRYNGVMYTLTSNAYKWPGHTFLGWSLDPDADTPTWTNRAKVGNLAEAQGRTVTLYAVWK